MSLKLEFERLTQSGPVYLVTGGAGFIGSALLRHLHDTTSAFLVNLDSLTYAANLNGLAGLEESTRYHFIKGDVRNTDDLKQILAMYQPDAIFHLAAESHVDRSIQTPIATWDSNANGTFALLEAIRYYQDTVGNTPLLINVSTDEVFGASSDGEVFDESSVYNPSSPYSASKAAADLLVNAWIKTYGLRAVTTTSCNNYGPYQNTEKLIPNAINKLLKGEKIALYGNGLQKREWLHVQDHVEGLRTLAGLEIKKLPKKLCFTSGINIENLYLAKLIAKKVAPERYLNREIEAIVFTEDRLGHDKSYRTQSSKAKELLTWTPMYSFEDGLNKTIEWYMQKNGVKFVA
jgi:dTDP-glucose 4,6-dehydratase